jgi:hypothetical protein
MRKPFAFALAGILALALAAPTVAKPTVVKIDGNAGWVNTGIAVTSGQELSVKTLGYVLTAKIPYYHSPGEFKSASGPEGQDAPGQVRCGDVFAPNPPPAEIGPCALDDAWFGELIGRVDAGPAFHVGDATTVTAPATGTLWLAVNDFEFTYYDNHGTFTVQIQ